MYTLASIMLMRCANTALKLQLNSVWLFDQP